MSRFSRRGFLGGLLTVLAAPAIIRTPGLLMSVKATPPVSIPPIVYVDWSAGKVWYILGRDAFGSAVCETVIPLLSDFSPPTGSASWTVLAAPLGRNDVTPLLKTIDTGRII